MPTAAIAIAGPAWGGSPDRATGAGGTGAVATGASSVAQLWQKTRSGGLTVPHDGQVMPPGSDVSMTCVSVVGSGGGMGGGTAVDPASVGVGGGGGGGTGDEAVASFSPVHSR